uniref:hypothetical protein n=1 Tax=Drosera capensis TaxID=4366 RepID=UPI00241104AF|nr:hypothetical protein P8577_pgp107 [Drosera capensis]WEQ03416.1 hypothetical protein [Drosera capensis]
MTYKKRNKKRSIKEATLILFYFYERIELQDLTVLLNLAIFINRTARQSSEKRKDREDTFWAKKHRFFVSDKQDFISFFFFYRGTLMNKKSHFERSY